MTLNANFFILRLYTSNLRIQKELGKYLKEFIGDMLYVYCISHTLN